MRSLAVIGTGIAGMACAYFLRNRFALTVYEKNDYVGGHTNTLKVNEGGNPVPIDTGFMVYNDHTYPNLIRLFHHLEIQSFDTSMSFGVTDADSRFETSFTSLSTFFTSWKDLVKTEKYQLLLGLKHLFTTGKAYLNEETEQNLTLAEFVERYKISRVVTEKFLLPMTAAIWSTPTDRMLEYPARTLLRFLTNHGMLGFGDQFQWKTVVGGSQQYKDKILDKIGNFIETQNGALRIKRTPSGTTVIDSRGNAKTFDVVIVATHADQALQLLDSPSERESNLLSCFKYNVNPVALHSDPSVMPSSRRAWASWNYRYERRGDRLAGSTHYWMNKLQNVSKNADYFVSVDYDGPIDESKIHWRYTYEHPRFDTQAITAQPSLGELNANGPIYYCGSYFRYGFHEDAFTSALDLCTQLNDGKDPLS